MTKPIFIIKVPPKTPGHISQIQKDMENKLSNDYYCIVVQLSKGDEVEFEMFNGENIDEITLDELKKELHLC